MFTELRIANFKPFGQEQRIPLRPITLLYGANSSGKSSVIHSLGFLRAALADNSLEPPKPRLGWAERLKEFNLGTFKNVVFRQEESRSVTISLTTRLTDFPDLRAAMEKTIAAPVRAIGLEVDVAHPASSPPILAGLRITADDKTIMKLRRDGRDHFVMHSVDPRYFCDAGAEDAADALKHALPGSQVQFDAVEDEEKTTTSGRPCVSWREEPQLIERSLVIVPDTVKRAPPPSADGQADGDDSSRSDNAGAIVDGLFRALQWPSDVVALVVQALDQVVFLDASRTYPNAHIDLSEDEVEVTPLDWAWIAMASCPDVKATVQRWFSDDRILGTPYEVTIGPLSAEAKWFQGFQVQFYDKHFHINLTHQQVGYGLSQVVPVLATLRGERRLFAIDQPELHLHPGAQAELGDLFIESVRRKRNQYILETHSEHLLLRLLRRIRETTEGTIEKESPLSLRPRDLSIVVLKRTDEGTVAHPIRVDGDGELIDPWPDGFFPERRKELM